MSGIQRLVGYAPRNTFEDRVRELVSWVAKQQSTAPGYAHLQLAQYRLVR